MPAAGFQSAYDLYRDPAVILQVEGKPADDITQCMTSFTFEDEIGKLPKADMELVDADGVLINDTRLEQNTVWSVRFGYPTDMSKIQDFRVAYFEPKYTGDHVITIKVTLLHSSTLHKVASGRTWGKIASSAIAKKIAARHRLKAIVEASGDNQVVYVQSQHQTDFEFLQELAGRIDYECFVEQNTLYYRSRDTARNEPARATFFYGGADQVSLLKEFWPVLKTHKGKKVSVVGADTRAGKKDPTSSQQAKVKKGNGASPKVINSSTGSQTALGEKGAWDLETGDFLGAEKDTSASTAVTTAETDPSKVTKLAKAVHRDFLERASKAEAHFIGSPQIKAKTTFGFQGIDRRVSGDWYCRATTHKIDAPSAYNCTGKLHRGVYKAKNKAVKPSKAGGGISGNVAAGSSPVITLDVEAGRQVTEDSNSSFVPMR